ncbi:MAG: hypothetical protein KDA22_06975 [Phycisphaerales bacterium]|nr:hypothetical protein [Phycisphaerales bacterium]
MASQPNITKGTCHVTFAFDIGQAVRLDAVAEALRGQASRLEILDRRRAPSHHRIEPAPILVRRAMEPVEVGGFRSEPEAMLAVYDFAGLTVGFTFALSGPLESLVRLSDALYENLALGEQARMLAKDLLQAVRTAVTRPGLAEVMEDYCIYQLATLEPPLLPEALLADHGGTIARILRAEQGPLSEGERRDAMESRLSYRPDDLLIIDWNAALALDRDIESSVAVLTFANLELLELRVLDARLDDLLDEAYDTVSNPGWRAAVGMGASASHVRRIAHLQVDAAVLYEQVNNAIKLLGDQFLARVYRVASRRFHIGEWDTSILRKLSTVEQIYAKVNDGQAARRMEYLEWIIILLIAVEVVMSLLR